MKISAVARGCPIQPRVSPSRAGSVSIEGVFGNLGGDAGVEVVDENFVVVAVPALEGEAVAGEDGVGDVEEVGRHLREGLLFAVVGDELVAVGPAAGAEEGDVLFAEDRDGEAVVFRGQDFGVAVFVEGDG